MKHRAIVEWFKKHDVLTKALSVLIAVVLWLYVVNVVNPSTEHTYYGISPVFVGEDAIMTSQNLMVVGKYTVNVKVSGSRKDIRALDKNDIRVEVDLSSITEPGTYELPITIAPLSSAYTIRRKSPEKLNITIDKEVTKALPVEIKTEGLVADGYFLYDEGVVKTPKEVRVVGRREEIDQIASVRVHIPQKSLKTSVSGKMEFQYFDKNGKQIKKTSVTADCETIDVHIPVYKQKEIPLSVDVEGSDSFKKHVRTKFDTEKILVAGEGSVIEKLSSISVGSISISDIGTGVTKDFDLTMPDGIVNLSGRESVSVKMSLDGLKKKEVTTSLIEVTNIDSMPAGYRVRPATKTLTVVIVGTEANLAKVNSENVRAVVDLKGASLNKATYPKKATIVIDGVDDVAVANPDKYTVNVTVS